MGVRIKTISNDIPGAVKSPDESYHVHHAKSQSDPETVNKIWELEWEVLGKKLNKNTGKTSSTELDTLHRQLREKDEQLKQAEHKISELKKQLNALQDKQRGAHRPQPDNRRQEQKRPAAQPRPATNVQKSPSPGGYRR
jgi:septal ring factor EnvC (AmiA/AmiB activator)